jgi:hypothetical protein
VVQTRCFSFARTKPIAEAARSTRTGLLFTNFFVRLGNPFKVALAWFTARGSAWSRLATTNSAEPVFLLAFAATFLTDLAEITDLLGFELMRRSSATIMPVSAGRK